MLAAEIDPAMRVLKLAQRLDLDRRVADDLEQLLVAPHVAFQRGDVEIADDQRGRIELVRPPRHAAEEVELLAELGVHLAIGHVAACGDVDVFDHHALAQHLDPDVPRLAIGLPVVAGDLADRYAGNGGDAVITLLPAHRLMGVAQRGERLGGEEVALALDFLQAQDVGCGFGEEFLDQPDAQTRGVDVPGGDRQHGSGLRHTCHNIPAFTLWTHCGAIRRGIFPGDAR